MSQRPTFEEIAATIADALGISVAEVGEMSAADLRAAAERLKAELVRATAEADQASALANAVERAHGQVRPLLTNDSMTTADVWPPGSGS